MKPLKILSGGELQWLKLDFKLNSQGTVYLFDEPTAGLHLKDTQKLMQLFNELVENGNSLVVVEHNLSVIGQADWLIDVGPDAERYGEQIMYSGPRKILWMVHSLKQGRP